MSFFNSQNKTILISGVAGALIGGAAVLICQELFPSEGKKLDRHMKKMEKEMQDFANVIEKEVR